MIAEAIGFEAARGRLLQLRPLRLGQVFDRLRKVDYLAQAAMILADLNPNALEEACTGIHLLPTDAQIMGVDAPLISETLAAIEEVAPLDLEFIDAYLQDDEILQYLYPESCGFPMGWDEWNEIINDGFDCANDQMSLYIFFSALRLGQVDVLLNAMGRFGWDLPLFELDGRSDVDLVSFCQKLTENGLGCFINALNMCCYNTGNPYFDFNPYDESDDYDLPSFSVAGVRALRAYWQSAQPILADYHMALDLFNGRNGVAEHIFALYLESCAPIAQGTTLLELWSDDEGGDGGDDD